MLILGKRVIALLLFGLWHPYWSKSRNALSLVFLPSLLYGTLHNIWRSQIKHAKADHRVTHRPCTFFSGCNATWSYFSSACQSWVGIAGKLGRKTVDASLLLFRFKTHAGTSTSVVKKGRAATGVETKDVLPAENGNEFMGEALHLMDPLGRSNNRNHMHLDAQCHM